jgi:hypothetical protein
MKKMNPQLKEQYDILAAKMDLDDNLKILVRNHYLKFGSIPKKHNAVLAAFLIDDCKLWRDIPKVRKSIFKAAKRNLKNIRARK